jgi:hypothetical protein
MPDYKSGKWAAKIIDLQKDDGGWGYFHTLAMPTSGKAIATEQAINRLRRLGFTKDDEPIQKVLTYMHNCLANTSLMPDPREKRMDWDIFIELMLASWIRRFTGDDDLANGVAAKWKTIVEAAFQTGSYDPDAYINTFYGIMKPKYGTVKRHKELLRMDYYYPVAVLAGEIDERIEQTYFDYTIDSKTGYYYTYQGAVSQLPKDFHSREASRYLAAVELYCEDPNRYCKDKLKFVVDWLHANQNANGKWDMGAAVKDGTYFPLSDSWRSAERREEDCTYRIEKIISALQ